MALLLVASYPVYANAQNAAILTTPSFTPSNGDILIVKLATWDTATTMGVTNTGSQTFNLIKNAAPGGFSQWCAIYAATVSGSPGSMTVSSTAPTATSYHSMVVERWSGGQLATTPATNATITGASSPPNVTVTTTAANSVVTWASGDVNSSSPATRAYLSSATEDGLQDGSGGANGVTYFAYQTAATAGAQTVGMSAPTNQHWNIAAMEIQAASAPGPTPFQGWGVPM
jgi:hypothetical protein